METPIQGGHWWLCKEHNSHRVLEGSVSLTREVASISRWNSNVLEQRLKTHKVLRASFSRLRVLTCSCCCLLASASHILSSHGPTHAGTAGCKSFIAMRGKVRRGNMLAQNVVRQ